MSFKCDAGAEEKTSASQDAAASWFLAYTRPRYEAVALQNLQQQGFDAYLPLYKCLKKTDTSIEAVFEPMFARYVFFRPSNQAQSIGVVRSTRGVAQLVSFGHALATIRPDTLNAIRALEQARNAADVAELSSLCPGQLVRFCNSSLRGLEGLVKSVSSRRVAVLLELMGRQQIVSVDHCQLEAA